MSVMMTPLEVHNGWQIPEEWQAENFKVGLIPLQSTNTARNAGQSAWSKDHSMFVLPITWRELLFCLRSETLSEKPVDVGNVACFGDVILNFDRMEATRSGVPVPLTRLQFKLLGYFTKNPYRVIPRSELLDHVWGFHNYPSTRTVDTFMVRLRQKFEVDPSKPAHFYTVHGSGYKFVP